MRIGRRDQSNVCGAQTTEPCQSCGTPNVLSNIKFCNNCGELLCQKCISKSHNHHVTSDTGSIAAKVRKNASTFTSSKSTQGKIGSIQQMEKLTNKFRDELLALETDQIDAIKRHIAKLHQQLDQIGDCLIQNVTDNMAEEQKSLSKLGKESKKMCTTISSLLDSAKQIAEETDDIIVINRGMSVCDELTDALNTELTSPSRGPAFDVKYVPGILDGAAIQVMCGQISAAIGQDNTHAAIGTGKEQSVDRTVAVQVPIPAAGGAAAKVVVRLADKFSVADYRGDICLTTGDMVWVGRRGGKISEVDRSGRLTRTVDVTKTGRYCTGITTSDDGWLVTVYNDSKIYRVTRDGRLSTWATTSFRPFGIKAVSTDRVLVCGDGAGAGLFTVTERKEQQVDIGVKCKCIGDVASNKNVDVAVTDYDGHQVVIMDSQYRHLGFFKGETGSMETFSPGSITSDGDIFIVCDPHNYKLHFVDRRGICLSVYQTTGDCPGKKPWRVDMTPGSPLWVSFEGGDICVYDLM